MASQAGAYAALVAGGVLTVAAFTGHSLRDVLLGKTSPLKALTSTPPDPAEGNGATEALTAFQQAGGAVSKGARGAVEWASSVIGTKEGSGAQRRWAEAVGVSPAVAWCSVFIAAVLREAGVKDIPAEAAYSGAWLNWKGGTNLHTTNLAAARPGDLIILDWGDGGITDHIGLYAGNGEYIAGNNSNNEVGRGPVPTANIVGIVRPHYPASRTRRANPRGY